MNSWNGTMNWNSRFIVVRFFYNALICVKFKNKFLYVEQEWGMQRNYSEFGSTPTAANKWMGSGWWVMNYSWMAFIKSYRLSLVSESPCVQMKVPSLIVGRGAKGGGCWLPQPANKDLSKIMEIEIEKRTSANLENKLTLVVGDSTNPRPRLALFEEQTRQHNPDFSHQQHQAPSYTLSMWISIGGQVAQCPFFCSLLLTRLGKGFSYPVILNFTLSVCFFYCSCSLRC